MIVLTARVERVAKPRIWKMCARQSLEWNWNWKQEFSAQKLWVRERASPTACSARSWPGIRGCSWKACLHSWPMISSWFRDWAPNWLVDHAAPVKQFIVIIAAAAAAAVAVMALCRKACQVYAFFMRSVFWRAPKHKHTAQGSATHSRRTAAWQLSLTAATESAPRRAAKYLCCYYDFLPLLYFGFVCFLLCLLAFFRWFRA